MANGIRRTDIQPCRLCGKGLFHDHGLMAYRVTVEAHVLNLDNMRRAHGLETLLGSPSLAVAMGGDEELTDVLETRTHYVCMSCLVSPLGALVDSKE